LFSFTIVIIGKFRSSIHTAKSKHLPLCPDCWI